MRTEQLRFFHKSCLALAIMSLSACATTDGSSGAGQGSFYERVGTAGKRSMEMSSNAWQHTREALGLDHQGPDSLLDEVDLALMEEDAVLPSSAADGKAAQRQGAARRSSAQASILDEPVLAAATERPRPPAMARKRSDEREVTIVAANYDESVESDYLHEVTSSDTLWSIARRLTGDPGNWQQIADFNDLSPDASVRAGQQLRIPRELLTDTARKEVPAAKVAAGSAPAVRSEPASARSDVEKSEPAIADPAAEKTAATNTDSDSFTVQANETLWDLAKRATGDATLWKVIAEHNTLSDRQITLVHAGQTILVPADLIKTRSAEDAVKKPSAVSAMAKTRDEPAADIEDDANVSATATVPAAPVTRTSLAAADVTTMDDISDEQEAGLESIMVSGTYYPKAVYNKADFSSSLLMRVSPGTALKVAGAQGPWFKVETDKGLGYMHARDIR